MGAATLTLLTLSEFVPAPLSVRKNFAKLFAKFFIFVIPTFYFFIFFVRIHV